MKVNEAPEKIILSVDRETGVLYDEWVVKDLTDNIKIEYVRSDAFIEKAKKWFEKQCEWRDMNGVKHCDMESFDEFRKYMEGEKV